MILNFLSSAVVACMATVIFFVCKANVKMQRELNTVRNDIFNLEEKLRLSQQECRALNEEKAWKAGMDAGRKSDALYRQIIKKYTGDQQFTVMMNGLEEDKL